MGKVVINVRFNVQSQNRAWIGWEVIGEDDCRYHINLLNVSDRTANNGKVYKNSKAKYRTPGYFDTRTLDATKPGNAKMIADVFVIVDRDQLMVKAIAEHAAKQAADNQAMTERAARLKWARELFAAMRVMIETGTNATYRPDDMRALLEYAPQPEDQ